MRIKKLLVSLVLVSLLALGISGAVNAEQQDPAPSRTLTMATETLDTTDYYL